MNNQKTTIAFSYHHENEGHHPETEITYKVNGDADLTELCEAFENFLLASGFRFNNGETIGIIDNNYV
jgi:hypothetical protein